MHRTKGYSITIKQDSSLRKHMKSCAEEVKHWPQWKRDCIQGVKQ